MNHTADMPITSELELIVEVVSRRQLVAPAIFLLEMGKPLVGCMRELSVACEPLLRMIVGEPLLTAFNEVLSSAERVEALILRLEAAQQGATK
jgi:hypothetical protein